MTPAPQTAARRALVPVEILAAAALAIFAGLAVAVMHGSTQPFDDRIRMLVHSYASPSLTAAMQGISRVGEPAMLIDLGGALFIFLLVARKWHAALLVFLAVGGGEIVDQLLKLTFHRPRPAVFFGMRQPLGYSFPSGHSLVSCAIFGALAVFVLSRITSRPLRWLCYGAAVLAVLAIGLSRVYLGMHYPTDVLGGYVAAVFWLSVVYLFWRRRDGNRAL